MNNSDNTATTLTAEQAITSRRSIRQFLPRPVGEQTITKILEISSRAPSGTNMQPWRVYIVTGDAKARLTAALVDAHFNSANDHHAEYPYYPKCFAEPYKSRRRKVGWDLYGLLDIEKGDADKMKAQHARNYEFFDAPVGLIFTIDRDLERGNWLDYGMFLQNIMTAARGEGLDTCPQAAFIQYHKIIRATLDIDDSEMVICGMSLGYADQDAPVNQLITERAAIGEFVKYLDN